MVLQLNQIKTKAEKRIRYLITIDETETPAYVSRELQPGVITIMITARTPEEARQPSGISISLKRTRTIRLQSHLTCLPIRLEIQVRKMQSLLIPSVAVVQHS